MRLSLLLLTAGLVSNTALAVKLPEFFDRPVQETDVKVSFMNVHSGPGRGFPIFNIAEKGEKVEILRAHTDWFQIRTQRGISGWAYKNDLLPALNRNDSDFGYAEASQQDYESRKLEFGLASGEMAGNSLFSARAAYRLNNYFSPEFAFSNVAGDFSTSTMYVVQFLYHPFRFGAFEPHFILGAGQIATEPRAGLIGTRDSRSSITTYGLGLNYYWTDRFILRADWQSNNIYASAEQTEMEQQWTIGLSYFLGSGTRSLFEDAFNQQLDVDDFELSAYTGLYNLQDFGSSPMLGAKLAYHLSEDVFVEGAYAQAQIDDSQFREVGLPLFPDDGEDTLSYYNITLGINLLPGEILLSDTRSLTTQVYLLGGAGMTRIVDQQFFTSVVGMGMRIMPWQKWALHIDARDHIFESDILGEKKTTHNLEWQFGVSYFL